MHRVLVVEDIDQTQQGIIAALKDTYDSWNVEGASSVVEARSKIDSSLDEERPYGLVILDYRLPREKGYAPEGSLDLTDYAFQSLPDALLIQITSYMDDEQLQQKLIQPRLVDPDPRLIFIPKSPSFLNEIVRVALQRLLGDPIADQLDDLFGSEASLHSSHRSRANRLTDNLSLTHRLASVRGQIASAWDHLSPELQRRIKSRFKVDDAQKPVRITMF